LFNGQELVEENDKYFHFKQYQGLGSKMLPKSLFFYSTGQKKKKKQEPIESITSSHQQHYLFNSIYLIHQLGREQE